MSSSPADSSPADTASSEQHVAAEPPPPGPATAPSSSPIVGTGGAGSPVHISAGGHARLAELLLHRHGGAHSDVSAGVSGPVSVSRDGGESAGMIPGIIPADVHLHFHTAGTPGATPSTADAKVQHAAAVDAAAADVAGMGTGDTSVGLAALETPISIIRNAHVQAAVTTVDTPVRATPSTATSGGAAAGGAGNGGTPLGHMLTILHFNDVYHVEESKTFNCGGAARFVSALRSYHDRHPLVLFSGDVFAPSALSTITRGEHMVPVLRKMNIAAAVVGNHDFDHGVEQLAVLMRATGFPWLLSNVTLRGSGLSVGGTKPWVILHHHGMRIGVMGLVEREWMDTLSVLSADEVDFSDPVVCGNQLVPILKAAGAEIIIALTHCRLPNDQRIAEEVKGLYMVLGGHDHSIVCESADCGVPVIKSGTDFFNYAEINIPLPPVVGVMPQVIMHDVTRDIPADPDVAAMTEEVMKKLGANNDVQIALVTVPLDATFAAIRTRETNVGNLVADIMRQQLGTDIALLNSGSMRADKVFQVGPFTLGDLQLLLPTEDPVMVIRVSGAQVLAALENSVSMLPKTEGRFAQVSGVNFSVDVHQPQGHRVVAGSVFVGGHPLDLEASYTVAARSYIVDGKDGYTMFPGAPVLVDAECAPILGHLMRSYCRALEALNGFCPHDTVVRRFVAKCLQKSRHSLDQHSLCPHVENRIKFVDQDHPVSPASRILSSDSKDQSITIMHFNDVYNIDGAPAFLATYQEKARTRGPVLILFSGDAFSPSSLSATTRGKHMVPVLNRIGVQMAVFGNHEFDFGLERLEALASECDFPWILSNVFDKTSHLPLGAAVYARIFPWQGLRIGVMGLIEKEWLDTLATISADDVLYEDYVTKANELVSAFRASGTNFIIALTHMRWPNDERLATMVPGIDLILGGHDHETGHKVVNGVHIIKSGTDFRQFAMIDLMGKNATRQVKVDFVEVDPKTPGDPALKTIVDAALVDFADRMDATVGQTIVALDARFNQIRTRETNMGNFVTDIMRSSVGAEIGILNSGTLRSDQIHGPGPLKLKDLNDLLPMQDPVVKLELSGADVLVALENGVSQYPKTEGRFPQVSGIKFKFDPRLEPGHRLVPGSVIVDNLGPLDPARMYTVATKGYLALGKDGYTVFQSAKVLVDAESGPTLPVLLRNRLRLIAGLNGFAFHERAVVKAAAKLLSAARLHVNQAHVVCPIVEGRIVNIAEAGEDRK